MSSLRSAGFDQAGNASGTLRIVASAMSGAGVRSRSGCPMTRAEAAHARMLEALRGGAWVRARLRDSGFDAAARATGEPPCVCRSLDAPGANGFQPAANYASRCKSCKPVTK